MTARKTQTFLTLLGIVFGTIGYIVISGVMLGFREYLLEQLVNNDAHIKISPMVELITTEKTEPLLFKNSQNVSWYSPPGGRRDTSEIKNNAYWYNLLSKDPDVEAFSRQFTAKIILTKGSLSEASKMIGIEPGRHSKVTNINDNMVKGKFSDLGESGNKIIIGDGLANLLGIKIYDTVFISAGVGISQPFKVVGSFRTGNKAMDESVCYGSLYDVQTLTKSPGKINSISVRLKDISIVKEKAENWSGVVSEKVESWEEINASFLNIFKIQDTIRYSITIAILVVSGFGIYNILNIVINQKKREIAILRSIGYEANDILIIFLIQGVILGIAGAIFGMLIGNFICHRLKMIQFSSPFLSTKSGYMLISFHYKIYIQAFTLAFIATLLASIIPARAAGKLEPIEIIRGEI